MIEWRSPVTRAMTWGTQLQKRIEPASTSLGAGLIVRNRPDKRSLNCWDITRKYEAEARRAYGMGRNGLVKIEVRR